MPLGPGYAQVASEKLKPGSSALLSDVDHAQAFGSDVKPVLDPVMEYSPRKFGRVYVRLARCGMLQFSEDGFQETVGQHFS